MTCDSQSGGVMLRFEVRDTGIGIPEAAQAQLFRAFTQVEGRFQEGTGLGLAIARGLVHQMGGQIGVLSSPDAGSTFWFTANFSHSHKAVKLGIAESGRTVEGLSVLVVDDNETSRANLKSQLESWKMVVDTVPSADAAMEALREQAQALKPYSIALLDEEMPGTGGLELARMIRQTPQIAQTKLILLFSGVTTTAEQSSIDALNIAACLAKPVMASQLFDVIADAIVSDGQPTRKIINLASEETPPKVAVLELARADGRKPHVLLAEDNSSNRRVALWQLNKLGCITETATDGIEVLEALARGLFDLVLMDCRMPRMDGYQATRLIREREGSTRHTKIVAMTAHALVQDRKKCLDAGMDDYLSKPVTLEGLQAILLRTLSAEADDSAAGSALDPIMMTSLRAQVGLLSGLIESVLKEIPEQLQQIAEAIARADGETSGIAAHSLKGTAGLFGAQRMRNAAAEVERSVDAGLMQNASSQLERLRAACDRVLHELEMERTTLAA
jgi:two-component system, sensor histidine kinase and response regulator